LYLSSAFSLKAHYASEMNKFSLFNQVFRRKKLVIRLRYVGGRMGGWAIGRKQFLLCATPRTFLNGFWPNFHRSFVIKCPGAYFWGFMIRLYLT
jgi:hypothetical protein